MALKIRGSSQILSNSIEFEQIQKISPARILGLSENSVDGEGNPLSAAPTELQATDIRKIANLWEDDSPTLNGLSLDKYEGAGGNLSVEGTGSIDGDFSINTDKLTVASATGNLDTSGSMTSADDIKLTKDGEDKHHLDSTGNLTSLGKIKSKDSFEIVDSTDGTTSKFDVDNSGNLTASGTGTFTSDITSGSDITLSSADGKITSKLLEVGVMDGEVNKKMVFDSDGKLTVGQNVEIGGNLNVKGAMTTIESTTLKVDDSLIFLASGNDSDLLDIGFVGQSSNGFHGLVRDKDDQKFKLFNTTENLSETDSVDFYTATLGTLSVSSVEATYLSGELTGNASTATSLDTGRDFSVSGDVSTASAVSFDGTGDIDLSVSLGDGVVDFAHIHDDVIVLETEGLANAAYDSDSMIPTAAAVIDYVDSKVSSGGFSTVADMDLQMGYDGAFVRVEEKTVLHTVKDWQANGVSMHNEETNQIVLINGIDDSVAQDQSGYGSNSAFDSRLDEKIMLFVNGQKLRIGTSAEVDAGTADFSIELNGLSSNERSAIRFLPAASGGNTIAIGDELEIKYYCKY